MITFYGYAVKKNGKWLGHRVNPQTGLFDRREFFVRPRYPVVYADEESLMQECGWFGKIVKVKLTMEKEGANDETK